MLIEGTKLVYKVLRPLLFQCDAEAVHEFFLALGQYLGRIKPAKSVIRAIFSRHYSVLNCRHVGISFKTPVGLAAGFDYEGKLSDFLPALGFGFQSVGTVTYGASAGNPRPRLSRLVESKAILVNKGYKNKGIQTVSQVISGRSDIPIGLSIGATNSEAITSVEQQIEDIERAFNVVRNNSKISYFELNISCPNVRGQSYALAQPQHFSCLLRRLQVPALGRAMFIKMPIELPWNQFKQLCDIALACGVSGVIIGNLAINRDNPALNPNEVRLAGPGSFSGLPTRKSSNELISRTYQEYGSKLIIIGVGGIFSAADAYEKICRGASLVQLITGLIFQGPQLVAEINKGLADLVRQDGYKNIFEAIGSKHRKPPLPEQKR